MRTARAHQVLRQLGLAVPDPGSGPWVDAPESDLAAWARSGGLWLTGTQQHLFVPAAPVPLALEAALDALRLLCPDADLRGLDARLLGERAAIAGLSARGDVCCGGAARLIRVGEEWVAPNLPRPDDWRLVPAWLEREVPAGDHAALARALRQAGPVRERVERGRELGLAIGWRDLARPIRPAVLRSRLGARAPLARPWVVDLSSLWAGPLCADLLRRCGARVTKVESCNRPDGARRGPAAFFDLMNAGKESVALDLDREAGRDALRALLECADVVLESARPRAMRQLGVEAERWVAARPGRVWASITGYGRADPGGGWIAFGDDAAVSAGLLAGPAEARVFVGDAIADPITGAHAAVAIIGALRTGGGELIDASLSDAIRAVTPSGPVPEGAVLRRDVSSAARPAAREPEARARTLGADNERVLAEIGGGAAHSPRPSERPR